MFKRRSAQNTESKTGGFLKKQLLDIIEWEDDSQDTLVYKFPMQDNEIQNGGRLVVRESQVGIFMDKGVIADVFGPGTHRLTTDNLPILGNLKGWAYGFKSPFKSDVYFVNTKLFINQKWGTKNPIWFRDPEFGQFSIRAFGTFAFQIKDPAKFLREVSGTNRLYKVKQVQDQLISFVNSNFNNIVAKQGVAAIDLTSKIDIVEQAVNLSLKEEFSLFGLDIPTFTIESINFPEELEKAMTKRTQVATLGGIQSYAQLETLDIMRESVKNPGMNSMNQAGMGFGIGLNFGSTMANNIQMTHQNQNAPQPFPQQQQQYPQHQQPPVQETPPAPVIAPASQTQPTQDRAQDFTVCLNCNSKIAPDSAFCSMCGEKVNKPQPQANICKKCGNENTLEALFCNKCGNKLKG